MELWPRRIALGGGVAGHEEERRGQRVFGGDKLNWWVGWTRKVKAELGQALPRRQRR